MYFECPGCACVRRSYCMRQRAEFRDCRSVSLIGKVKGVMDVGCPIFGRFSGDGVELPVRIVEIFEKSIILV